MYYPIFAYLYSVEEDLYRCHAQINPEAVLQTASPSLQLTSELVEVREVSEMEVMQRVPQSYVLVESLHQIQSLFQPPPVRQGLSDPQPEQSLPLRSPTLVQQRYDTPCPPQIPPSRVCFQTKCSDLKRRNN